MNRKNEKLFIVILFFATALSTSLMLFPMKPAAAQGFLGEISLTLINDCFEGFPFCESSAFGSIFVPPSANPAEGSSMIEGLLINECADSDNPADETLCFNTSDIELSLLASDQAFIESNSKQLSEQTNKCIADASCENTGGLLSMNLSPEMNS